MYQWGLACCAIEMGAAFGSPRYDVMRLGVIPFPASPRQADLVVISGTVTDKMAPAIRRLYEQMPDPKYVISMGSCANCGGPYWDSYSVTKGVDQIIPVDVYVPGCPPRPEALLEGIVLLQERIQNEDMAERWRGEPIVVGGKPTRPSDQPAGAPRRPARSSRSTTAPATSAAPIDGRELGDAVVGSDASSPAATTLAGGSRSPRRHLGRAAEAVRDGERHGHLLLLPLRHRLAAEPRPVGREGLGPEPRPEDDAEAPPPWRPAYAGGDTRFQVFARLYSTTRHVGLTLKADLDDDAPTVESIHTVFRGADWHERETWEMYGFDFVGHPGLRHLYLPAEFEGFPLRKDFPLLAREVKPWPGLVDVEPMPGEDGGRRRP